MYNEGIPGVSKYGMCQKKGEKKDGAGFMEEMTIKDIAKVCGVGVSTVSRAINNHPDINPETKKMIMATIKKHGYIPNNSARNLKRTDAKTIAVLVKGITNPFFSDMIKIMEREIQRKKYTLVLHHVEFNEDEVDVALELIKEKRLRGIVFLGGYFYHAEEKLAKIPVPFVLSTTGCVPENMNRRSYSSVSVDDEKESCKMVSRLIESGHTRIAILCAQTEDVSIGLLRLQGYKRALGEHGLTVDEELIYPMKKEIESYSMQNGYVLMQELLASGVDFTAVYAISDVVAIGACRAIVEAGKRIPEDYSVAGFDGIEMGDYYIPTLTTVKQPVEEMAYETIALLFDILAKRREHQHKVFEGRLMVKESTRPVSIEKGK